MIHTPELIDCILIDNSLPCFGMDRKEHVTLTNMCMITNGNNVLVQNKRVDDDFSGITFPGGHVEPREPVIDAMIRELQEETGLTVTHPKLVGIKEWMEEDGDRYIVFLYTADTFSGDLQSSREGEVFWTPLETLLSENCIWHMDSMLKVFTQEYSELFLAGDDYIPVLK